MEGCGGRREGKGEIEGKKRGGLASYGEKERRGRGERGRGERERKRVEAGGGSGIAPCEIIEVTFLNPKHEIEAILKENCFVTQQLKCHATLSLLNSNTETNSMSLKTQVG